MSTARKGPLGRQAVPHQSSMLGRRPRHGPWAIFCAGPAGPKKHDQSSKWAGPWPTQSPHRDLGSREEEKKGVAARPVDVEVGSQQRT
jgi:hypothetical protein